MIILLMLVGYVAGWLVTSVCATRWIADNKGRCTGRSVDGQRRLMDGTTSGLRRTCDEWHGEGCWRADGEITPQRLVAASALSAAWPLVMALGLIWSAANRKPTVVGLQREIARLEREAGLQ